MKADLDADGATEATLRAWVAAEMLPWTYRPFDAVQHEHDLTEAAREDSRICLLRIEDGSVSIDPAMQRQRPFLSDPTHGLGQRVAQYVRHLTDAAHHHRVRGRGLIGLFVADGYPDVVRSPLFCFQKPAGAAGLLLPDVDLLSHDYCLDANGMYDDPVPFSAKRREAVFVGSTTGERIASVANVTDGTNQRVAAALFFRDVAGVTFRLPNVVQCTAVVRRAIEALNVGGSAWTWGEQQQYRYLLSLDGNGATCSRVAGGLHGHQLLAKYASPNQLYYFRGLEPWRHYMPITAHADVLDLVATAEAAADWHGWMAAEGRRFARAYLTRPAIRRYTALLLAAYLHRFGEGGAEVLPADPSIDVGVRAHGRAPRWATADGWAGDDGHPLARVTLFPFGWPAEVLRCEGVTADGTRTRPVIGGEACAAADAPLAGLRATLQVSGWRLRLEERFADGTTRAGLANRPLRPGPAPLVALRVAPERRRWWQRA